MNTLGFPAHFCRHVPIELLHLRHEFPIETEWRYALREDIDKNGLASPLICNVVHGRIIVRGGQNRLRCLRELGWKYVPCIVSGELPDGLHGLPLNSVAECQEYLADGVVGNDGRHLKLSSALLPESGKFPKTNKRYTRDDRAGS